MLILLAVLQVVLVLQKEYMVSVSIPDISLGLGAKGESIVYVDDTQICSDLPSLLRAAPSLLHAGGAAPLARAINHFSRGNAFEVIEKPAVFAENYRQKLASEDPDAPWQEGIVRLADYGIPDFDAITAPALKGSVLTYYAVDTFLGLPYQVTVDLSAGHTPDDDDYRVLELIPISREPDASSAKRELSDEDRAFLKSLKTTRSVQD